MPLGNKMDNMSTEIRKCIMCKNMRTDTDPITLLCNACKSKQEQVKQPGKKFDAKKLRIDLVSIPALMGQALVLTHGALKYGEHNWEKGMNWSRIFGGVLRHLFSWWLGVSTDNDSGLDQIDQVVWGASTLSHYSKFERYQEFDDRFVNQEHKEELQEFIGDMLYKLDDIYNNFENKEKENG